MGRFLAVVFLGSSLAACSLAAAQMPSPSSAPSSTPSSSPSREKHAPDIRFANGAIPMPDSRVADSYEIYSMLMPGPELGSMQTDGWAIADTTVNTEDRNPAIPPNGQLKPPPDNAKAFEEAVGDFEANQHVRVHLTRAGFHLDHDFTLLTPDQVQAVQSQASGHSGVTFFSEVYFNTKHTAALVYRSEWCAHLCGEGTWIYLEKQGDSWVRQSGVVVPGA